MNVCSFERVKLLKLLKLCVKPKKIYNTTGFVFDVVQYSAFYKVRMGPALDPLPCTDIHHMLFYNCNGFVSCMCEND
jgi:hypothetical protein